MDWKKYWTDEKIIAIDPGANGGIAVWSVTGNAMIEVIKMPPTPAEVLEVLTHYQFNSRCYLEKVGGLPGMGGSAMFNFGRGFGQLEMALMARRIPTMEVTPQKWQKALQLGSKGNMTNSQWKNKLKTRAQQLYPNLGKITLATADALLILEYGRIEERKGR